VSCELDEADLGRILRSLHQQVKEQGLWACHLPPELGGQGYGQVKLVPGYPFSSRSPSPKAALSPDACFTPSTPWTVTRAHFGAEPDTWARACSKPH